MRKLSLDLLVDLEGGALEGHAHIELERGTKCFVLNRGLRVEDCSVEFSQGVTELADFEGYEVNFVKLREPRGELEVRYCGTLESYERIFPYLKDRIGGEYTLLRTDTYFYPIFAEPRFKSLTNAIVTSKFDAEISVSGVPDGYEVASGGEILGNRVEVRSTWRLDIAIARFSLVKRGDLRAFVLVGSEEHGERILELVGRAFDFYCSRFGERERRYTIIEIPDGYGGQAGVDYSLVESRALREPIPYGVYHELAHFWNPKAEGEVQRSRFFDEAFANYLTALLIRELYGEEEFRRVLRELREAYWRLVNDRFPEGREVPLADYGRYELGALSYSKGALVLHELHKLIGDGFYELVRECCSRFRDRPIDFESFKELAEEVSGRPLGEFFNSKVYGAWDPELEG